MLKYLSGKQIPLILLFSACLASIILFIVFLPSARAQEVPLWGAQADDFTIQIEEDNYVLPENAGEYCDYRDFTLKTIQGKGSNRGYKDEVFNGCAASYDYGVLASMTVAGEEILQLKNSDKPYRLLLGWRDRVVHIPGSKSLFTIEDNRLRAYDEPLNNFEITDHGVNGFQNVYRVKDSVSPRTLEDSNGDSVAIDEVDASPNGEWLIIDKGKGDKLLRVNPKTFDLLAFPGGVSKFNQFSDHDVDMAISNDGRYVAMAGGRSATFKLYDLSTCEPDPSYNLHEATGCDPKDSRLKINYLQEQLGGRVLGIAYLQFNGDATQLSATVGLEYPSGETERKLVTFIAAGHTEPEMQYLALGDSFSSGEGDMSGNYLPGTDGDNGALPDEKCHVSTGSYPFLLAAGMNLPNNENNNKFSSVACSGAVREDILNLSNIPESGYLGQFDQYKDFKAEDSIKLDKEDAVKNLMPGRAAQIEFVQKYKPKAITVGIGGNNLDFSGKLKACLMPQKCQHVTKVSRTAFGQEIANQYGELKRLYTKLHEASPKTKIYVLGYPQFISSDGLCKPNVQLDVDEREYIRESVTYLNLVIAAAAKDAGMIYVDIENSLAGKELCAAEAFVSGDYAVNAIVPGDDKLSLTFNGKTPFGFGNESFHPKSRGHEVIAAAFQNTVVDPLTHDTCPQTEDETDVFCPSEATTEITVPDYFQPGSIFTKAQEYFKFAVEKIRDSDIAGRLVDSFKISLTNLQPASQVRFELWSEPTQLGTYQTDANGEFTQEITVPDSVEPGYHTLRAHITTAEGEEKVYYQTVLVVGSENDLDGDGVPNENDKCSFVDPAGVDVDKDGVDDACDRSIDQPPLPEVPTLETPNFVNASTQNALPISGKGDTDTVLHVTIDDANPDTDKVVGSTSIGSSSSEIKLDYSKNLDVSSLDDGQITVTARLTNQTGDSPITKANIVKDTEAPNVKATVHPTSNEWGWHSHDAALTLNATDETSGVKKLIYKTIGAQKTGRQVASDAEAKLSVTSEGKTKVIYFAKDKAGNRSQKQIQVVRIDKTAPVTHINNPLKPRPLMSFFGHGLKIQAADATSKVKSTKAIFKSRSGKINTVIPAYCLAYCNAEYSVWRVKPNHLPTGVYTVTAQATDRAGNPGKPSHPARVVVINFPAWWR